jgi:hypothetical protein
MQGRARTLEGHDNLSHQADSGLRFLHAARKDLVLVLVSSRWWVSAALEKEVIPGFATAAEPEQHIM